MLSRSLSSMLKVRWKQISLATMCQGSAKIEKSTAGILVIGDEILRGDVLDTNSNYLSKQLRSLGITVKKISIIGDNVDAISDEIKVLSKLYKYVITTGGIGPTHDDVTFEGVAKAFDQPVVMNKELMEKCFEFYKTNNPDSPGMKLAKIPQQAVLNYDENRQVNYPNISVGNVYMFPGIPELLRKSFSYLGASLFKSEERFYSRCLHCNVTEDKLTTVLDQVVKKCPDVQVGSYPQLYHELYKVKITIESTDEQKTKTAYDELLKMLPQNCIVEIKE